MPMRVRERGKTGREEERGGKKREIGVSKVISTLQHNGSVKHS